METLIELLNEYYKPMWYTDDDIQWQTKARIISKECWFIEWLVENDKIDTNKLKSRMIQVFEFRFQEYANYENTLLMLLAIEDEPIQFLCEILK